MEKESKSILVKPIPNTEQIQLKRKTFKKSRNFKRVKIAPIDSKCNEQLEQNRKCDCRRNTSLKTTHPQPKNILLEDRKYKLLLQTTEISKKVPKIILKKLDLPRNDEIKNEHNKG